MSRQRHTAGELTELVTIRRVDRSPDGGGGFERIHKDFAKVRAKIRPLHGAERVQSDRVENTAGYMVIIRSRPGVDEAKSIYWHQQKRVLNIRFVRLMSARNLFIEMETDTGRAV